MKQLIIILFFIILFSGCATTYGIKDGKEYVRLNELQLSGIDQLRLHWLTDQRSEYAIYDNRAECFYYQKDYDYSGIFKK